MKDFKSLKVLDKFRFLYTKLGIDYELMRKILKLKLTVDSRRVPAILSVQNNKSGDKNKKSNSSQYFYYAFLGLFIGLPIFLPIEIIPKMNLVLGVLIFMITLTMISDFSYVLLDIRDLNILYPRPIDKKVISAARTTHIIIYLICIIIPMSAFILVFGFINHGVIFLFVMLIELLFISIFTVFLTAILYYLILHFFDGEKLKDIINNFQILLSIFMIVGYQLAIRVFDFTEITDSFKIKWYTYLLPSSWFATPFGIILEQNSRLEFIILGALAFIVPLGFLIIYNSFLGKDFEQNLIKLNNNTDKASKLYFLKSKFQRNIANFICSDNIEASFYKFAFSMFSKDRQLKLHIYPNITMAIVFPYLMLFTSLDHELSLSQNLSKVSQGNHFLNLYFYTLMISSVIYSISYSEKFKGAWIYKVLPIKDYKSIHKGAYKSFVLIIIVPTFVITILIFLIFGGLKTLSNILLILINTLIVSMVIYQTSNKELPFSQDVGGMKSNQSNSLAMMFASSGLTLILWGIHFGSTLIPYGFIIAFALSLLMLVFYWKRKFGTTIKNPTSF
ncbi:hypothetical protein SH2C18_24560 [Clostridium sediminicola]|uniref:ABC transporter permease n=1 Tax=Clostridium sediminicola TaxID=3114879 RepID=UPI0031F25E21